MQMEYDAWSSTPMSSPKAAVFDAGLNVPAVTKTLDLVTVHAHQENGSTLTVSSPLLRLNLE